MSNHLSFTFIWLLLATALSNGCVQVFPDPQEPTRVTLTASVNPHPTWQDQTWQLNVGEPTTNLLLNSQRIAVRVQKNQELYTQWDYVQGKLWLERVPKMLQAHLVEQLAKTGRFKGVAPVNTTLDSKYTLLTAIYEFHINETREPTPSVSIRVLLQLKNNKTQMIAFSHHFSQTQPAAQKTFSSILEAFNTAYSGLLQDSVDWIMSVETQAASS